MNLLGLKNTFNGQARASGIQWYGHILRRALLEFEEAETRGHV